MALVITFNVIPTVGFTPISPKDLRDKATDFTGNDVGPFDVVGLTIPRIQSDPTNLNFVTTDTTFHIDGGTLVMNLSQEVFISSGLSGCRQFVVQQHENGHVKDNIAVMPSMDPALRADDAFAAIMIQGQEFPISQSQDVKEQVRQRIESVFSALTGDEVTKRDTPAEYQRMDRQLKSQCPEIPASNMQRPSTGPGVATAQLALNAKAQPADEILVVDGIFGSRTQRATIRFQSRNGLANDGVIGPKTREKLGIN